MLRWTCTEAFGMQFCHYKHDPGYMHIKNISYSACYPGSGCTEVYKFIVRCLKGSLIPKLQYDVDAGSHM